MLTKEEKVLEALIKVMMELNNSITDYWVSQETVNYAHEALKENGYEIWLDEFSRANLRKINDDIDFDFSNLWLFSEKHNNIVASGQYVKVTNVLHNENRSSVFFEIDLCGSNPVYIDARDIGIDKLFMLERSDTDPSGWKAQLNRIERELNAQAPNPSSN